MTESWHPFADSHDDYPAEIFVTDQTNDPSAAQRAADTLFAKGFSEDDVLAMLGFSSNLLGHERELYGEMGKRGGRIGGKHEDDKRS